MELKFDFKRGWRILFAVLIVIGLAGIIFGLLTNPARAWANILLNNYLFIMLSIGALFFYAVQYVTHSGWSAMFQRIPLAAGVWLPIGAIVMFLFYFGMHYIYEWTHPEALAYDKLLQHKSPYLNIPFFYIRVVIYFILWIGIAWWMRKLTLREDIEGTLHIDKHVKAAGAFLFAIVFTFTMASIDWIMSIDAHWFSTLFGLKNLLATIYYAVAFIILLMLWLQKQGYLTQMNEAHRNDFARYLFRLSIVWGYLWFVQYLVIWYANIPEATMYYVPRAQGEWSTLFYLDFALNFAIPFLALMNDKFARTKIVMIAISLLLLVGMWISLFLQIMPGSIGILQFGIIEISGTVGFIGLYLYFVFSHLSKIPLIPVNHPYLEESKHRHF
ncbi:MAG: hypothetical protein IH597_14065 [Bacteroidales bacterium]|nr:hypothetical protein [Bacteroidales bacterium]